MNKHTTVVLNVEGRVVGKHVTYEREEPTKRNLHIHCDVVHPESGEVLAEPGPVLDATTPRAQHVLRVAEAYPDHYTITEFSDGTHISAEVTQCPNHY